MLPPYIFVIFCEERLINFFKLISLKEINITYGIIIIFLQITLLKLIHKNNIRYESKYNLISHKEKKSGYIKDKSISLILIFRDLINPISQDVFGYMKKAFGDHLEQILLFSASSLVVFTNYTLYKLNAPYVIIYSSLVVAFLIFTNIVLSVGHSEAFYPKARIFLKDGNIFKGTILRFGNNISILTNDKKYTFNKGDISYIEEEELQK